jgi:hypothetical protein
MEKRQVMKFQRYFCGLAVTGFLACSPLGLAHDGGGGGHGGGIGRNYNYRQPFGYTGYPSSYSYDIGPYAYTATPEQQEVAKKRVKTYYAAIHKGRRRPARHRYIAVETLRPTKQQRQDYVKKRLAAKGGGAQAGAVNPGQLHCLMVFDTEKKQFVGSSCYLVEGLPNAGTATQFESVSAEYVGQL